MRDITSRALYMHGSLGLSTEMPFAQWVLDSFHMGLADGVAEVHKITAAKQILRDYRPTEDLFPDYHLPKVQERARAKFADVIAQLEAAEMAEAAA
jgi:acyl-CoA dehydrogenase